MNKLFLLIPLAFVALGLGYWLATSTTSHNESGQMPASEAVPQVVQRNDEAGTSKTSGSHSAGSASKGDANQIATGDLGASPFINLPHAATIISYMNTATSPGPGAMEKEAEALKELQKNAQEVADTLFQGYKRMNESEYDNRRLAMTVLAQLNTPKAIPSFVEVINTPIPPEKMQDTHYFSSVKSESLIKVAALRGLESLAKNQNQQAETILFEVATTSSNLAVIQAAIVGYLNAGNDVEGRAQKLKGALDPQYHALVITNVSKVETLEGQAVDENKYPEENKQ